MRRLSILLFNFFLVRLELFNADPPNFLRTLFRTLKPAVLAGWLVALQPEINLFSIINNPFNSANQSESRSFSVFLLKSEGTFALSLTQLEAREVSELSSLHLPLV